MAAIRQFKRISDLIDVDLTGLVDGNVLVWDATDELWKPGAGGGTTPAGDAVTLDSETPDADGMLTLVSNGFEFRVPYTPGAVDGTDGVLELASETPDDDGLLTLTWGDFAFRIAYLDGSGSGTVDQIELVSETPDADGMITLTWGTFAFRIPYFPPAP